MAKTDFQNEVVNRVRKLRTEKAVSQVGLAKLIDVGNGQIGNIESPKFPHKYTIKQLYVIARCFNVSIGYLFTGNNDTLTVENLIEILIKYDG